ncbi:MAG: hypothetical protein AAB787_01405 [Patescibacteria group bacterium]
MKPFLYFLKVALSWVAYIGVIAGVTFFFDTLPTVWQEGIFGPGSIALFIVVAILCLPFVFLRKTFIEDVRRDLASKYATVYVVSIPVGWNLGELVFKLLR